MKKSPLSILIATVFVALCSTSYGQLATTTSLGTNTARPSNLIISNNSLVNLNGTVGSTATNQLSTKLIKQIVPKTKNQSVVGVQKPRCLADEITTSYIKQQMALDPMYQKKMTALKNSIQQIKQNNMYAKKVLRTVPVVVHVVHNPGNSNSPSENVSNSKIYAMINTLNEDFQRLNSDASQTRAVFLADAADAQIEFCLASKDPSGVSTTGITRTVTSEDYYDKTSGETNKMKSTATGGADPWDGTKYLNIWICNISNYAGFGVAGYAYLPSPGMHGSAIDGLVLDFDIGVSGRTPTHEIGHYFNLNHTWGSNPPSCSKDDGFADTPNSGSEQYGCNYGLNTCGTTNGDQIENYMSYAYCQNMFSNNQSAEMNAVLSGVRSSLLASDGCEPTAPPVADFTASMTTVVVGGNITFTDLTTGLPDTWAWNFGGGGTPNTSALKNPNIVFSTIGTYTVTLTATNSLGSNVSTKAAYIDVIAVPPPPFCGEDWVIYCEDFASGFPIGWVKGQVAPDAWAYSTVGPVGVFKIDTIASTTAANGFMLFDSDDMCSGNQDAYFYTVPINLSAYSNVRLEFQQYYRAFSSSTTFVSLSTNGTTWTDYQINRDILSNGYTPNAEYITMDISADVGGSSTAFIKFTYTSTNGCDYAWMIDDIKIKEIPTYDAEIEAVYYMTEYTITPKKHIVPLLLQAVVNNNGANTASNVTLAVNVYEGDLSNNVFTGTAPVLSSLAAGVDTVMTVAGGFTPTDTGFYISEYIVTISDSDGIRSNDTAYLSTLIVDSIYARDAGAIASIWNGAGNPFDFGQSFELQAPDYVNSITVFANGQTFGDTIKLTIYDMVGGKPNTLLGATADYIFTAADTPGVVLTLPINGGPLALPADTFYVGMKAYNKTGTTGLVYANAIITSGTSFGSIDGGAWETWGGDLGYSETFTSNYMPTDIALFNVDALDPYSPDMSDLGFDNTDATAWIMNGYTAMSTSYYTSPGTSDDWLITPAINLGSNYILTWDAVAYSASWPDGYQVWISTTVQTPTACMLNTVLFTIAAEDTVWTPHSIDLDALGYKNQTVYIGFRNNSNDKLLLGLDNILVGVPGPLLGSTFRNPFVIRPNFAQCNMTLTSSTTNAACGSCNGIGVVTPVGGFYPFTYLWNDTAAQTDSNATGLCQGSYQVQVTDNNGCVSSTGVTITDAASMSVTTVTTTESCGDSTGTATATATGGTGGYNYLWDDPAAQTTQTATSLKAGTYNVTVTDGSGCTVETEFFTAAVVSNIPPPTTATAGADSALCDVTTTTLGGNAATVGTGLWSVSSGTAMITTASSPTSGVTGLVFGSSATLVWTISNGGCPASADSVVISVSQGATTNAGADTSICSGSSYALSGTIGGGAGSSVWTSGGTGTFDDSSIVGAIYTPSAADIIAGAITLTITTDDPDAGGPCSAATDDVILTISANPTVSIDSSVNILCTGDATGSATAAVTGGTAPYTYGWSDDPIYQSTITATGLLVGTYGVMVTDSNGCSDTVFVTLTEPATALSGVTGDIEASCGVADGVAYVAASGGTGAYTYFWNDPSSQTTDTATGLLAGPYNVMITDSNSCMVIVAATVSDAGAPSVTVSNIVDVTCYLDSNGSADVSASGGAGPLTYTWSTGGSTTSETGMWGGTHSVTVEDSIGCTTVQSVTINEPTAVTISSEVKADVSCNTLTDGMITVVATGGTGTISYSVDSGTTYANTSGVFTPLGAGTYSISVRDSNSCTTAGNTIIIIEPAAITITSEIPTDALCNGGDGDIFIAANGGTGTLSYSVDSGTTYGNTTGIFDPLSAGTYGVSVQDSNGCTATGSMLTINEPTAITITSVGANISCNGADDGTITITASGGTPPYSYSNDGGSTYLNTSGIFSSLTANTYNVAVQDSNGCIVMGGTEVISEPAAFTTSTSTTSSNCGLADGEAVVAEFGGTPPYAYLWDDGNAQTTQTATGLFAGTYNVVVTDSSGCTSNSSAVVADNNAATSSTSVSQSISCFEVCDASASVTITNGTAPYVYSWNDPASQTTQTAINLCAGTHIVNVTYGGGCSIIDTVTITEPALLTASVSTTPETAICNGTATATPSGGTGPYNYAWNDPGAQLLATATGLCPGNVMVIVTDANGCTATSSNTVGTGVGITELFETLSFTVYPNPNQGSFKVAYDFGSSLDAEISIYSKIGALLIKHDLGSTTSGVHTVDMSKHANGIYYVQLITDQGTVIKKISLIK